MKPEVCDLVLDRASVDAVARCAVDQGMMTLFDDGMAKVGEGLTSIEEILA